MNDIPQTPQDKSAFRFICTAIYSGIILFQRAMQPAKDIVDRAEAVTDEVLRRVPEEPKK